MAEIGLIESAGTVWQTAVDQPAATYGGSRWLPRS
jgi:hypothetical protein